MAATESLPSIAPLRLRNKESKYPHNYDSTETPSQKHAPSWGCQLPSLLPSFVARGYSEPNLDPAAPWNRDAILGQFSQVLSAILYWSG